MPFYLPVNSDGNREIVVNTGGGTYRFRTYYSLGQDDGWFLDISDVDGVPLLTGIRIVTGCPNILKGNGDLFKDVQLAVAVISGKETGMDNLGVGTFLVWYNEGEVNDFVVGDPLVDIPVGEWDFGEAEDAP